MAKKIKKKVEKEIAPQLMALYQQSHPNTQKLLQLVAVIHEPASITRLLRCVKPLDIRDESNKIYTQKSLKNICLYLLDKGILEKPASSFVLQNQLSEQLARQALAQGNYASMYKAARNFFPLGLGWNYNYYTCAQQCFSDLRHAVYNQQDETARQLLDYYLERYPSEYERSNPLFKIFFDVFDEQWMLQLSPALLFWAIENAFHEHHCNFSNIEDLLNWLVSLFTSGHLSEAHKVAFETAFLLLMRGQGEAAQQLMGHMDDYFRLLFNGIQQFIQGENAGAIEQFEAAIAVAKKGTRKRKIAILNVSSVFYLLALIKSGSQAHLQQALAYSAFHRKQQHYTQGSAHQVLARLLDFLFGQSGGVGTSDYSHSWQSFYSTQGFLLHCFRLYWMDKEGAKKLTPELKRFAAAAEQAGDMWLASEAWQLLAKLSGKSKSVYHSLAHQQQQQQQTQCLIDIIRPKAKWEQTLDAIALFQQPKSAAKSTQQSRLIWWLFLEGDYPNLQPREQKQTVKGGWTKGRNVALKRLKQQADNLPELCAQDRAMTNAIYEDRSYYYGSGSDYELNEMEALYALAGHPLLFDGDHPECRLELIAAEPEIRIRKKGKNLSITLEPDNIHTGYALHKETATRWRIIHFNEQHQQLSEILGNGLKVPAEAKDQVLEAMAQVAPLVNIHSDIGGELGNLQSVETDSAMHVLLAPVDEGFSIEARSRVFGQQGPYYPPGQGSENIITEIDGKRVQTQRELKQERQNFDRLLSACPLLAAQPHEEFRWFINEPEECLEVLSELHEIKDEITIAWPKGEALRIKQQASMKQFRLNIEGKNDWFSVSGELTLDDGEVLNMQQLLSLSANAKGRFIELEDGQFIALSKTFQNRLKELNSFGDAKGKKIELHPLAALSLADMGDEVGQLKAGRNWKTFSKRFEQAMALQPEVPSTLQAELRDYQTLGFQWLVRLAHWGAGACLADDMGLGKTLQALALILYRCQHGPSLVVAPTSVSLNWIDEIQRFAPTLNIIDIRENNDPKQKFAAFDLVVASYGLLQNRIEQLEEIDWQTIVLDEAQAIKNPATKRSQASMRLGGKFKMITTGTPIENHLGELWNLYRFINPGLLGSLERFNQRFALPISRDGDSEVSAQLKKLIQPFILRRLKTQVLKELPARTEIALNIEMSKQESKLYEALRREAVEKFSAESDASKKGHRQLQILAAITRLRQACCNPQLVMKQAAPDSSKLAQFAELIDELLKNHHKALVFSQFVGHLKILEEHLKQTGISYQYLDGSTTPAQRKKRVNAFQGGAGDVFLISLKAGGVGLNLTAADYVIHMDPWWNPAVEDQASDRAHRIGQTRPVTVYRLVMKDTIEEKILALHLQKRDLADSLLAGTDVADKLNAEDLLELIKQE